MPGSRTEIVLEASAVGNLMYQLDCLSGAIACSLAAYEQLWKRQLGWSAEDDQRTTQWKALRERYTGHIEVAGSGERELMLPMGSRQLDLRTRQQLASYSASSLEGHEQALGLLMREQDAAELSALARHFLPRFERWWAGAGRAVAERFVRRGVEVIRRLNLAELFDRVQAFYEADLPQPGRVRVHVMVQPASSERRSHATQLENHAVVEVLDGEDPAERIDVVSHELFHYFYANMRLERRAVLEGHVAAAEDSRALIAYSLMDEVLATGLGNGLVGRRALPAPAFARRLEKDLGMYADPYIDRGAKAVLTLLASAIERGLALSSEEFARRYVGLVSATLPADPDPLLRLAPFAGAAEDPFPALLRTLRREARSESSFTFQPIDAEAIEFLRRYPMLSAALMLTRQDVRGGNTLWQGLMPAATVASVQRAAEGGGPFAYTVHRNEKSRLFLLVADDEPAMRGLVDGLMKRPPAGEGLIIR